MSIASHCPGLPPAVSTPSGARWRTLCLTAALLASASTQAQTLPYRLDPAHTRVHWEVMHFGTSTHRGRFDDVQGQILFDRASKQGEVSVTVGTASVTSGVAPLDGMLRGEYFFSSAEHPRAYFVARRFVFDGERLASVTGELTVRDTSVGLTLQARRFQCAVRPDLGKEVCGGDFEGEVLRGPLGITYGLPFVADRVRLVVQVEAIAP